MLQRLPDEVACCSNERKNRSKCNCSGIITRAKSRGGTRKVKAQIEKKDISESRLWHCDGYDKLKPYGFPIHSCIYGWSRKILWLYLTQSNNQPNNIGMYYLEAVQQYNGCPVDFITNLGTEMVLLLPSVHFLEMIQTVIGMYLPPKQEDWRLVVIPRKRPNTTVDEHF